MTDAAEESGFIDLEFDELSKEDMNTQALNFFNLMNKRRTTRHFSNKNVPRELIEYAIKTAGTSPSGAHLQPWTFVAISNNYLKKKEIFKATRILYKLISKYNSDYITCYRAFALLAHIYKGREKEKLFLELLKNCN